MSAATAADYAVRYIERFGIALTPLHGKVPIREGWNRDENLLRTPAEGRHHFSRYPLDGMGVCLEPSGLVSVDADNEDWTRRVLGAEGIDLDQLMASHPTIIGRSPRIEFAAPKGVPLSRKSLVLPAKGPGEKPITVFEFRAGRVQDAFPPSIHPNTGKPYRWMTSPRNGFLVLPDELLRLWLDFDAFKRRALRHCPWAEPEPDPKPLSYGRRYERAEGRGPNVIGAFNEAYDPVAILEAAGYQRVGKRRWKSPGGSGMAGVVQLPTGKIFCHHTSDSGLADGHAHDAFDLYRVLEHGGDFRLAVKAAAQALGMTSQGARK